MGIRLDAVVTYANSTKQGTKQEDRHSFEEFLRNEKLNFFETID